MFQIITSQKKSLVRGVIGGCLKMAHNSGFVLTPERLLQILSERDDLKDDEY